MQRITASVVVGRQQVQPLRPPVRRTRRQCGGQRGRRVQDRRLVVAVRRHADAGERLRAPDEVVPDRPRRGRDSFGAASSTQPLANESRAADDERDHNESREYAAGDEHDPPPDVVHGRRQQRRGCKMRDAAAAAADARVRATGFGGRLRMRGSDELVTTGRAAQLRLRAVRDGGGRRRRVGTERRRRRRRR